MLPLRCHEADRHPHCAGPGSLPRLFPPRPTELPALGQLRHTGDTGGQQQHRNPLLTLLPPTDGHLLDLRPAQALLPGTHRDALLLELRTPSARPGTLRPLRPNQQRRSSDTRRRRTLRSLSPPTRGSLHPLPPHAAGHWPHAGRAALPPLLRQAPGLAARLLTMRNHRTALPPRPLHSLRRRSPTARLAR